MKAVRNGEIQGLSRSLKSGSSPQMESNVCLWVEEEGASPGTGAGFKGPAQNWADGEVSVLHVCLNLGEGAGPWCGMSGLCSAVPQELTLLSSSPPLPTRGRPSGNTPEPGDAPTAMVRCHYCRGRGEGWRDTWDLRARVVCAEHAGTSAGAA